MSDPDSEPADFMDELFDGVRDGDPLADEVEHFLGQTGGPVPVDEEALRAAVQSASRRLHAETPQRRVRWGWLAIAAAVLLVPAALGLLTDPEPMLEVVLIETPSTPGPGVRMSDASATVQGRTLVLASGVVSYRRDAEVQPNVNQVRIPSLDLVLVPVGTVFSAGVLDDMAAIHVTEGRVRVLHEGRPVSEIAAGSWVFATLNGEGLEVLQVEGSIDPSRVPEEDREHARTLFAQLRWMALSDDTREEIRR